MKVLVYEKNTIIKELDFFTHNNLNMEQFYQDIKKAINLCRMQSIWQLSKIITRHQLHKK